MRNDVLPNGWDRPEIALARTMEVLSAALGDTMGRLSAALAELVPHVALARMSSVCTFTPTQFAGDGSVTARIAGTDLGRLAERVTAGRPWQGEGLLGGVPHPVLAVASAPDGLPAAGALLVVVRTSDQPLPAPVTELVQGLWDLVTVHTARRTSDAEPAQAAVSRAAAGARARAIAELTDAHSTALSSILGTLRAASLDDATARRGAVDLAVAALVQLRANANLDRELSEEPADAAFARLTDELRPLLRYSPVALDLRAPDSRRTLPADVAHAARAAVRGAVLAMLEQGQALRRLHIDWQIAEEAGDADALRVVVRDDGPGRLAQEDLSEHRITDRLAALDGRLVLDALPGWGTTVTVTLPLEAREIGRPAADDPLDALHPREREVLEQLALGRRNREIGQVLHISESTVKFHVANILGEVGGRLAR
ncbi:regulatory protein, luxR family [Streptomyces sp. DvalAA-14]|uniref:helix-turn-helix transcriptional regulator n=1 Tax=unclassified Streptomyces TaxID=2593676 RepID=UPI00081B8128|nr:MULTISPECIES: LuxR C-terminal-related transcriptional regulator [unclassified Streptomyces]SCD52648.1 regulatory protein, luxR family [Streptomyces sp. DvalAA-14]